MSRFANLSERLSADLPKNPTRPYEDEEDDTTTSEKKDKEKKDMTTEIEQAKAEASAAGFKEANDRMNAVFASEHYEGREATAKVLLGKNMSADDIIDVLATTPKAAKPDVDTDAAARAEVLANIEKNANSGVLPSQETIASQDEGPSAQAIESGWSKATTRANQLAGY